MKKLKKTISLLTLLALFAWQLVPVVRAQEVPTPPPVPQAPEAPTPPPIPTAPPVPTVPPPPSNPSNPPVAPTLTPRPTRVPPSPTLPPPQPADPSPTSAPASPPPGQSPEPTPTISTTPAVSNSGAGGVAQNGQIGDTNIVTGNATNSGMAVVQANTNATSGQAAISNQPGGIQIANAGNGAGSDNSSSISIFDTTSAAQVNEAEVNNHLKLDSQTGNNSASFNTGGNNNIQTGDANVSGTAVTSVNTNIDGIMISEFNIEDNHTGDYVLDFAANCIFGCAPGNTVAKNKNNGANSSNTADINFTNNDLTFQSNEAEVGNLLVLQANTGNNTASYNTNGDSNINTGDANVSASSLTFVNNNLAGNVIYGVVNIYGDLIGDIVFPEEMFSTCCGSVLTAENSGNGAGSQNTIAAYSHLADTTLQTNDAVIQNDLILTASTGDNETSGNTGGTSAISTGNSSVSASVMNVVNSNIDGGNWWLVLVNEAGNWLGRIIGAPSGNMAGAPGTSFTVDSNGVITANIGNGAGSVNSTNIDSVTNSSTIQTNTAKVHNVLDLTANTGGNTASYNTGGDSNIQTGDANIIASIVNFVNNNVTGGGKLFVVVVNVFGKWVGDFVTPGQSKNSVADSSPAVGGAEALPVKSNLISDSTLPSPAPSSSPLPSITPRQDTVSRVFAGLNSTTNNNKRKTSSLPVFSAADATAQVAGYVADVSDNDISNVPLSTTKRVIKINLAWALLILPFLGILSLLRRHYTFS